MEILEIWAVSIECHPVNLVTGLCQLQQSTVDCQELVVVKLHLDNIDTGILFLKHSDITIVDVEQNQNQLPPCQWLVHIRQQLKGLRHIHQQSHAVCFQCLLGCLVNQLHMDILWLDLEMLKSGLEELLLFESASQNDCLSAWVLYEIGRDEGIPFLFANLYVLRSINHIKFIITSSECCLCFLRCWASVCWSFGAYRTMLWAFSSCSCCSTLIFPRFWSFCCCCQSNYR